jgi:hypothetical protein
MEKFYFLICLDIEPLQGMNEAAGSQQFHRSVYPARKPG